MPSRRLTTLALSGIASAALLGSVLSGGASVAATASTTVLARTLPGNAGDAGTSTKASTGSTKNRDLVVAWTNHKLAGRYISFYAQNPSTKKFVYKKRIRTNSVGEANFSGAGLAKLRWKVVAAKTSRTRADSYTMPRATSWKQAFFDDFSGSALGAKWRQRYPNTWLPGRTCTFSSPDMVKVGYGRAALSTQRYGSSRPSGLEGPLPSASKFASTCKDKSGRASVYKSAAIDTATADKNQFTMLHGVVAARVKFSPLPGQHAAVWLPANGARDTEIDVVESNGNYYDSRKRRRAMVSGVYYGSSSKVQTVVPDSYKTWSSKYHTFSVEWTPSQYIFRIGSRVILRTSKGRTSHDHYLSLTNFVADWAIKNNRGNDSSKLASSMYVDWVKAWTK